MLEDVKINVKIKLAAAWISHFLLWTFGDMVALLQETTEPISNLLLLVATSLALLQTFMIIFSLIGKSKFVRWANIGVALVYMLVNIGYLSEGGESWNYLLGIAYIVFNVLIIWYAWKWPKQEG